MKPKWSKNEVLKLGNDVSRSNMVTLVLLSVTTGDWSYQQQGLLRVCSFGYLIKKLTSRNSGKVSEPRVVRLKVIAETLRFEFKGEAGIQKYYNVSEFSLEITWCKLFCGAEALLLMEVHAFTPMGFYGDTEVNNVVREVRLLYSRIMPVHDVRKLVKSCLISEVRIDYRWFQLPRPPEPITTFKLASSSRIEGENLMKGIKVSSLLYEVFHLRPPEQPVDVLRFANDVDTNYAFCMDFISDMNQVPITKDYNTVARMKRMEVAFVAVHLRTSGVFSGGVLIRLIPSIGSIRMGLLTISFINV